MHNEVIFLSGIWPFSETDTNINYMRPIACYQLKSWLKKFDISSQVIEWCQFLTAEEIIGFVNKFVSEKTHTIACSATFWPYNGEMPANLRLVYSHFKAEYPGIKWIVGSPYAVKDPGLFDKAFVGESEDSLVVWCQEQKGQFGKSLFNKKFDITRCNHRFDETDAILDGEVLPIEFGRGCIFKCRFCSNPNLGKAKTTYQRQFSEIVEEMRYNYNNFGVTKYAILDDTINEDTDKVANMSTFPDVLGFPIEWVGYLRADLIWSHPETALQLKKSGLVSAFFGIETFHLEAGKSIGKPWAAKHGKQFLPELYHNIWDKKINMTISLIAGLPGEPIDSLEETLHWAKNNDLGWYSIFPLFISLNKVSVFAQEYDKWGYTLLPDGWETIHMTRQTAAEFSKRMMDEMSSTQRVSGWTTASAMNLHPDTAEILKLKMPEFMELIRTNAGNFIERYKQKLSCVGK